MVVAAVCTAVSVTTKFTAWVTVVVPLLLAVPPVVAVTEVGSVIVPCAAVGEVLTVTRMVTLAPGANPAMSVHCTEVGEIRGTGVHVQPAGAADDT
jgi:hypothetical protein